MQRSTHGYRPQPKPALAHLAPVLGTSVIPFPPARQATSDQANGPLAPIFAKLSETHFYTDKSDPL